MTELPAPMIGNEPTKEVLQELLKAEINKLSVSNGDVLIIRVSKEHRRKMTAQQVSYWMHAAGLAVKRALKDIGRSKTEVLFLDDGVKIEMIPIDDLKKIVEKAG
jgi:hypothetical protein